MTSRPRRVVRRFGVAIAGLAVAMLALSACTAVPLHSDPQVIQTLGGDAGDQTPVVTVPRGADPRTIVGGFLAANSIDDLHHPEARLYLTPQASNNWLDSTATVLDNPIANLVANRTGVITVSGVEVGTVDSSGEYTPTLGRPQTDTLTFRMSRYHGQWRIAKLPSGLILSAAQFQLAPPRVLYFYDPSEKFLIPDPRYPQLSGAQLASWLMTQLADGPPTSLQAAVTTAMPASTGPPVTVTFAAPHSTKPTRITVPNASQLASQQRNLLAAQIANTLAQVSSQPLNLQITDDDARPVTIPAAGGTVFTSDEFTSALQSGPTSPQLFYVHAGGVVLASGRPVPGPVGTNKYHLSSAALGIPTSGGGLAVAGVSGTGNDQRLWIGSLGAGLIQIPKPSGPLTRPAFAGTTGEAWIGAGSRLWRITPNEQVLPVQVSTAAGKNSIGTIAAVRLSPDGSRVAVVLDSKGKGQIYVGAVVRSSGNKVRVALQAISPPGVDITDVAWNDDLKLFAIGHTGVGFNLVSGLYEVQCDGSLWTSQPIGVPGVPDSITVAENEVAAVSTDGTVWRQNGNLWVAVNGSDATGSSPIYLE